MDTINEMQVLVDNVGNMPVDMFVDNITNAVSMLSSQVTDPATLAIINDIIALCSQLNFLL